MGQLIFKKMKKLSLLSLLAVLIFSCTQEFDITPSGVTYLPLIKLTGDTYVQLDCNDNFTPDLYGAEAFEGGSKITLNEAIKAKYFGETTVGGPDDYAIAYSAVNKDGIPGTASRRVLKTPCSGDMTTDISGVYTAFLSRKSAAGAVLATPQYQNLKYILIRKSGNKFEVSDALGGWYEYGRSLGVSYAALGLKVSGSGTSYTADAPVEVGTFGGEATVTSFTVDPDTKTINMKVSWDAGFTFDIRLVQTEI